MGPDPLTEISGYLLGGLGFPPETPIPTVLRVTDGFTEEGYSIPTTVIWHP